MATPPAAVLTAQHHREVAAVAAAAAAQVRNTASQATPADIDAWWKTAAGVLLALLLDPFTLVAGLTVRYLRSHAALHGVVLDPVPATPNPEKLATSLRVAGPVAFKTHIRRSGGDELASLRVMVDQLSGTAAGRVLDGDRDTMMATFAERDEVVGWRRVLNSPRPCAFCAMLASRGAVYNEDSVTFRAHLPSAGGGRACSCTAAPLYRHEPEPDDVLALRKLWEDSTKGLHTRKAINAFRRAWDPSLLDGLPEPEDDEADIDVDVELPAPAPEPVREPYPGGLSPRRAQEWMEEHWGADEIGKRAIFVQDLGRESAEEMSAAMDELFSRYPETAKRIRAVGASAPVTKAINASGRGRLKNISGRAYADAWRHGGSLRVSGAKARKHTELAAMLARDVAAGFHPPGTDSLAAVVRHEFGHFMYWVAQDRGGGAEVRQEILAVLRAHVGVEPTSNEYHRAQYELIRTAISRYATTNQDELLAEAFAYVTSSDEPSPLASALVDVMIRHAEA